MKGNNTLTLNTATLIEAVQFWLDAQMKAPAPKVINVSVKDRGIGSTFEVSIESETAAPFGATP